MESGFFKYEDCPLKHYIRTQLWVPICKNRKNIVKSTGTKRARERRLRYFTFCAAGAIDVLTLDVERVINPSEKGWFDVVCFFDRNEEYVLEAQKRIPGAIGFPGNFTKIVLLQDPQEDEVVDEVAPLLSPKDEADTLQTHQRQLELAQRRRFIKQFPFDIINLDLEEFLFKPNDPIPGKVVNALRKVFAWQRRPLLLSSEGSRTVSVELASFSLMFTTQIGPPNLSDDYLQMLSRYLDDNIREDEELHSLFRERTQTEDPAALKTANFEKFFKLAMPKTLLNILMEEDWHVDPKSGIRLCEIKRQSQDGPYKIIHTVMDVKRQSPKRENRAPGTTPGTVTRAYRQVAQSIFSQDDNVISNETVDREAMLADLKKVQARGRKYMGTLTN
jgi:hypothetical protein